MKKIGIMKDKALTKKLMLTIREANPDLAELKERHMQKMVKQEKQAKRKAWEQQKLQKKVWIDLKAQKKQDLEDLLTDKFLVGFTNNYDGKAEEDFW